MATAPGVVSDTVSAFVFHSPTLDTEWGDALDCADRKTLLKSAIMPPGISRPERPDSYWMCSFSRQWKQHLVDMTTQSREPQAQEEGKSLISVHIYRPILSVILAFEVDEDFPVRLQITDRLRNSFAGAQPAYVATSKATLLLRTSQFPS